MNQTQTIFTIGHSNHDMPYFIELLKQHNITAIADVRSTPYSEYMTCYNKGKIDIALKSASITYVYLGKELGARPQNQNYYQNGKTDFIKLAQGQEFKLGIERLVQGSKKYCIAIMCAEKEPLDCHRTILICRHLQKNIPNIQHILGDGSLKTHSQIEQDLIDMTQANNLFNAEKNQAALIDEAYAMRQQNIAYEQV